nr:methanogenesis marker protein Mmp4/MtxX [Candidatus Njordarchaeota archaeon]
MKGAFATSNRARAFGCAALDFGEVVSVLEAIIRLAQRMPAIVGLGISAPIEHARKTIDAALRSLWNGYAKRILLVGKPETFYELGAIDPSLIQVVSDDPESDLVKLLDGEANAIVRGSLGASKLLAKIKSKFKLPFLARLALLETLGKHRFFFAPVGIDEGRNVREKLYFISEGAKLIQALEYKPRVAVLSGGRTGDMGRDRRVDATIKDAEAVVETAGQEISNIEIKHYEIMIEDAIADRANLIIAPDGVSGNLIYRALTHFGGGTSHGAPYLGLAKPIVDTSRVGPMNEYVGAIAFASALVTQT